MFGVSVDCGGRRDQYARYAKRFGSLDRAGGKIDVLLKVTAPRYNTAQIDQSGHFRAALQVFAQIVDTGFFRPAYPMPGAGLNDLP